MQCSKHKTLEEVRILEKKLTKGRVMQTEKGLVNDCLRVSKVS